MGSEESSRDVSDPLDLHSKLKFLRHLMRTDRLDEASPIETWLFTRSWGKDSWDSHTTAAYALADLFVDHFSFLDSERVELLRIAIPLFITRLNAYKATSLGLPILTNNPNCVMEMRLNEITLDSREFEDETLSYRSLRKEFLKQIRLKYKSSFDGARELAQSSKVTVSLDKSLLGQIQIKIRPCELKKRLLRDYQ